MKRLFLFSFFILFAVLTSIGQNVIIKGDITNNLTNQPIANHMVMIMSDSSAGPVFSYYNTVSTDALGHYEVMVQVPGNLQIVFYVYTADCQGWYHSGQGVSTNSPIVVNFSICDGGALNCNPSFVYFPDSNAVNSYQFVSTSTGNPTNVLWDFGDGGTSLQLNPNHVYAQTGTYTVCLTIQCSGLTMTTCDTIYVGVTPPNCWNFFSYNTQTLTVQCLGVANGGTAPYTFHWNFGDGTLSNLQNPQHTYGAAGTYTITLTTTDANGCSATSSQVVSVTNLNCQASFYYFPDSSNTNTVYFVNTSLGANPANTTFTWHFGDNTTSNLSDPSHTYQQSGLYYVCLTMTSGNCTDTYCDSVWVGNGSMPCFNFFQTSTQGLSVQFFGTAGGGTGPYTYTWDFGDGNTSNQQNPLHNYAVAGNYTVTLTTTDSQGCTYTSVQTVQVNNQNLFTIWGPVYAGNVTLDQGTAELWSINVIGAATLLATVPVDSGMYSFVNVPQGAYYVKAYPSANSVYFTTYIPTYYSSSAFWAGADVIVPGTGISFYPVYLIGVIPPVQGPGHIGGIVNTGVKSTASGTPVAHAEVMLQSSTGDIYTYVMTNAAGQFAFNNLSYGTYKIYTEVAGLGTNPAMVTLSANNPSVNSITVVVSSAGVTTGLIDLDNTAVTGDMKVYPNPASDMVTVTIPSAKSSSVLMEIHDITGKTVLSQNQKIQAGSNTVEMNVEALQAGTYILKVTTADGVVMNKKVSVVK